MMKNTLIACVTRLGGALRFQSPFFSKLFVRYLVMGFLNTALSYAVYAIGLKLGLQYAVANLIALAAGILIGFRIHGKYVFKRTEYRLFWRFLLCWLLIYLINIVLIHQVMKLGFDAYVSGAVVLPFMILLSFVFQKFLVFRHQGA